MADPVAVESVGVWEAIKAVLVALPKLVDAVTSFLDDMKARNIQAWNDKLDEATRIGVDAGKRGLSVEEAIQYAQKLRDITGSMPRQP